MDVQPEIATSPIGMHYHVCESCAEVFTAETTDRPYPDGDEIEHFGYDANAPVWCGCDGSPRSEDKVCPGCAELLADDYHDDRDDEVYFADPGRNSALRAEHGVQDGLCIRCDGAVDGTDQFCRHCGARLNQRYLPCPDCGAKNALTPEDVALHYCCNSCADRKERDF
jgi:hypothetical protein